MAENTMVAVTLPNTLDNFEDALDRPPDFGGWWCGVTGSSCDHADRRACAQRLVLRPPNHHPATAFVRTTAVGHPVVAVSTAHP